MATETLPPRKPRTLVLCFDGTSNEYDADNTNVVKFFSLLKKDDFNEQLCYYQAGVGTYFAPGVVSPLFQWSAKILDLAVAWYLDQHVMDGYSFISQNYRVGDKICLFGFSRGAYTARALAGMLYKVGLLPKDNKEQINFAYKLFKRTDKEGVELSQGFKQTFSQDVKIDFVGVWDTVASVGVLMGRTLPFTNSNTAIRTFRHALSLDEHRAKFRANYYHRAAPDEAGARLDPEHASPVLGKPVTESPAVGASSSSSGSSSSSSSSSSPSSSPSSSSDEKEEGGGIFARFAKRKHKPGRSTLQARGVAHDAETDVKEVWFVGCHTDVGGGSVLDSEPTSLANVSLRWMVQQVVDSQCGILFSAEAVQSASWGVPQGIKNYFPTVDPSRSEEKKKEKNVTVDTTALNVSPGGPSAKEKAEREIAAGKDKDILDVTQGAIHDELKTTWLWWILEIVPTHYSWQDPSGVWKKEWKIHLGRGRAILDKNPQFHWTVKRRMEDEKSSGYKPKAQWNEGSEVYVE